MKPADWLRQRFLQYLGREPTSDELHNFIAIFGEYGCEPKTITLALVTSPDYQYY